MVEAHWSVVLYILCSSCMLVVNKAAMKCLPYVFANTFLQTAASALILVCARFFGFVQFPWPTWKIVWQWSGVLAAWLLPIVLNLKAIHLVSVETMMMFRSLTIVAVALGDLVFLRSHISLRHGISCCIISIGGLFYASNDLNFNFEGYVWGTLYAVAMVFNSLYIKYQFDQNKHMNAWEKSFLNNLLAMPAIVGILPFYEDPPKVVGDTLALSFPSLVILFLSCIMGLGISMSGTKCRDVLSATSFDVLGNCTKYLTLGISAIFLDTKNSFFSIVGICVALSGTALYSPAGEILWNRSMKSAFGKQKLASD